MFIQVEGKHIFDGITINMRDERVTINSEHIIRFNPSESNNLTNILLSDNSTIQAKCSYDDLQEIFIKNRSIKW